MALKSKEHKTISQKICERALAEYDELKKLGVRSDKWLVSEKVAGMIKKQVFMPIFRSKVVSMNDDPVSLESFTNFDPTVCTTNGYYTLTYCPKASGRVIKNRNYIIGQDLIRVSLHVSSYPHWKAISKTIPEFAWLQRWCPGLTPELFAVAKSHPGIPFTFAPDWAAYAMNIINKAKEQNINIDNKPYVTYMQKEEDIIELNQKYFLGPKRVREDISDTIDEINKKFEENADEE